MGLIEEVDRGVVVAAAWSAGADAAAAEIARQLAPHDLSGLVVFVSPDYDVATFAAEIARRFGATPVDRLHHGRRDHARGLERRRGGRGRLPEAPLRLHRPADPRSGQFPGRGGARADQAVARRSRRARGRASPASGVFGLLLVDGLCRREEAVVTALQMALDEIPIVGGSAGDGLQVRAHLRHPRRAGPIPTPRCWRWWRPTCRSGPSAPTITSRPRSRWSSPRPTSRSGSSRS